MTRAERPRKLHFARRRGPTRYPGSWEVFRDGAIVACIRPSPESYDVNLIKCRRDADGIYRGSYEEETVGNRASLCEARGLAISTLWATP